MCAATAGAAGDGLAPWRAENGAIEASLTGAPGDPARGRAIAAGRDGNCLACHAMPIPEQPFHGNVGPDLAGVGSRLSPGEIRLRLVDPRRIDEESIMPAFYKVDGLRRVSPAWAGRPILDAGQIEDIMAGRTPRPPVDWDDDPSTGESDPVDPGEERVRTPREGPIGGPASEH